ncbi:MAG: hypothetical protein IM658_00115 [Phenylobacterium sp.]|uniref:hypothetical protein n=1 Tax=Phenylobacterium sp. TaxID=1871053 RepID=UPI0025E2B4BE|nr:hypothetical protein [Phenylobacterium sp.]MCA3752032.1 hypothetical protein [Phenylobacterium sp.]MCA6242423.1 hypothetical protein [Phenylobacterium sp.]MCA6278976.1 hypothetical protein [Phenylobacterium sp.]MCA6282077.1 hypothetical protein [Phenylobacterium sp.]MCA6295664.1 hypothetical protein [Phenylobacterium sp.]
MLWVETKTDDDARQRSEAQWTPVWTEHEDGSATAAVPGPDKVDGKFWGDAIKEVRNNRAARLAMAHRQLPLPAAFREIALARRAIIRRLKKDGRPFDDELRQLHYWAALSSCSVPYSEASREPGYNILVSTPYAKLAELDLSFDVIGSENLPGLTQGDRKMMREAWGEPKAHTTAHELYGELWREQERKLVDVRTKRRTAQIEK